jgi:hypothetical protein
LTPTDWRTLARLLVVTRRPLVSTPAGKRQASAPVQTKSKPNRGFDQPRDGTPSRMSKKLLPNEQAFAQTQDTHHPCACLSCMHACCSRIQPPASERELSLLLSRFGAGRIHLLQPRGGLTSQSPPKEMGASMNRVQRVERVVVPSCVILRVTSIMSRALALLARERGERGKRREGGRQASSREIGIDLGGWGAGANGPS